MENFATNYGGICAGVAMILFVLICASGLIESKEEKST